MTEIQTRPKITLSDTREREGFAGTIQNPLPTRPLKGKVLAIQRRYIVSSKKLRSFFGIEGEIINVSLWKGRSPNDVAKGVSPENDEWEITTDERAANE